nr:MAG TPA: Cas system-associated protein [Caudoviricetes sp.]
MKKMILYQSHICIEGYLLGDSSVLEESLITRDQYGNVTNVYYDYDPNYERLYIPRGMDVDRLIDELGIPVEINREYTRPARMVLTPNITLRNGLQTCGVAFLLGKDRFQYTTQYSQVSLNLPPGEGKTAITITALTYMKVKPLIITHRTNIAQQWIESFLKFTNINESEILVIRGSDKLKKAILDDKYKKYKVFLLSHGTIKSYCSKYGWNSLQNLCDQLGVGVKVIDEAHSNFENTLHIDYYTNVRKTIYLTATLNRSDWKENRVLNNAFSKVPKFGKNKTSAPERHIVYTGVFYDSRPSSIDIANSKNYYGFNKIKFAEYCEHSEIFYDTLIKTMDMIVNNEGKKLILLSKITTIDETVNRLREYYPSLNIYPYHSKVNMDLYEMAEKADIIVSTTSSMKEGIDIYGLRYTIMCEAYSSAVQAEQASGRLRPYAPDPSKKCYYIELVDKGFPAVYNMYKKRLKIFKNKCYKLINIDM